MSLLARVRDYVQTTPGATNFAVAEAFGLSRGMTDRLLEQLEDEGAIVLDRPAEACGSAGSCGPKNPAARLFAMAAEVRQGQAVTAP